MDRLNEQRHRITDKVPDPVKPSEVRQHPKSLLLGAFGAGLTAGLVSEGGGGSSSRRSEQRRYDRYDEYDPYERSRRRDEGGGFAMSLIERTLGPAMATFQTEATDYLEGTVRELFGSRNGGRRERSESYSEEMHSEDGGTSRTTSRS